MEKGVGSCPRPAVKAVLFFEHEAELRGEVRTGQANGDVFDREDAVEQWRVKIKELAAGTIRPKKEVLQPKKSHEHPF